MWPNCSRGSVTHFWWQRSIWFGQWKWTTTSPVPSHSFRCWKLTGNRGIGIRSRSSNRKKVWVSCSSVCLFAHNCWNSGKVRNHVAALFGRAFLVCFPFLIFLVNDFFLWSFCFISPYSLLGYLPNDNSFGWRLAKRQNKKKTRSQSELSKTKNSYKKPKKKKTKNTRGDSPPHRLENKQLVREGHSQFVSVTGRYSRLFTLLLLLLVLLG